MTDYTLRPNPSCALILAPDDGAKVGRPAHCEPVGMVGPQVRSELDRASEIPTHL